MGLKPQKILVDARVVRKMARRITDLMRDWSVLRNGLDDLDPMEAKEFRVYLEAECLRALVEAKAGTS